MHDLRALRENPAAYDANWGRRGLSPQTPAILKLDEERRAFQTEMQTLQAQRNEKSKEIGRLKAQGKDAQGVMDEVAAMKNRIAELEQQEATVADSLNLHLASLPNMLADDVPEGADENANKEVRKHGEPKRLNSEAPDHVAIGEALGMMDFETAADMSGSRFVLLQSHLARMERALAQFMLDTHTMEHGYTEVSPPLLVNDQALYGTGQLPKFKGDLFHTERAIKDLPLSMTSEEIRQILAEQSTEGDESFTVKKILKASGEEKCYRIYSNKWLIPTAEVSLTNIVAGRIVDLEELPRRYTAWTPCFRSEAGAAGKDTKGMIRQHQFYKVELVSVTAPDKSVEEHERMTQCAENILKKLGLNFRTVALCTGDIGFGARKTYDIEVWLPGQQKYREISSCSNCWDFQARRMNAKCRVKGEKETQFVHTLNGSGVAVGRALIAVLENYYDSTDGGVFVPDVLQPYIGGVKKILPLAKAAA